MALPLGQGLPGLTGSQALGGVPLGTTAKSSGIAPYTVVYGSNAPNGGTANQTWTCPKAGTYRFVQWGAGGDGNNVAGGGGAGHAQTVRKIAAGATVTITSDSNTANRGVKITLALPDGTSVETTGGQYAAAGGAAGAATGGDINVSGSAGSGTQGGAAGSSGNYQSGIPGTNASTPYRGGAPGAGTWSNQNGGAALVLIVQEA